MHGARGITRPNAWTDEPAWPALSVVIPAYNEEHRLESTLLRALEWFRGRSLAFELLVVDDGSRDRTSEVVRRLTEAAPELRLIRLAANRGKGHAVRTGVLNATGTLVLFADADGATPWPEFDRLDRAVAGGADVAIGSRARRADDTVVSARPLRHAIGRCYAWLVTHLAVPGIHDTQCGFKLFRGPVAQEVFSRSIVDGFGFDVEVLLMARRRGYTIEEVPVNWVHQPGSRVNLLTDSLRMLLDLLAVRARALGGRYEEPHVAMIGPASPDAEQVG